MSDIRIFGPTNVDLRTIQHQQYQFFDPTDNFFQRRTVYTGELSIGHGTEKTQETVDFEYPLLGIFPPASSPVLGIFPINDPALGKTQFRSAVADTTITYFNGKDSYALFGMGSIRATLDRIVLDVPR